MNRKDFISWLDTIKIEKSKYFDVNYLTITFYNCNGYEYVYVKIYTENEGYKCYSENKVYGDRPTTNYFLTSKEYFESEELAIIWIQKKLKEFLKTS